LNADILLGKGIEIFTHNIFTYCKNNANNYYDPNGKTAVTVNKRPVIGGNAANAKAAVQGRQGYEERYVCLNDYDETTLTLPNFHPSFQVK
jgi:hypothetical protein